MKRPFRPCGGALYRCPQMGLPMKVFWMNWHWKPEMIRWILGVRI